MNFIFDLKAHVRIKMSGETGQVRARAEYATGERRYLIAMTDVHGAFGENWIDEDLLEMYDPR